MVKKTMLLSEVAVGNSEPYLSVVLCAFALYYCKNTEKPKCMNKVQNCDIVVFISWMNLTLRTLLLLGSHLLAAILRKALCHMEDMEASESVLA